MLQTTIEKLKSIGARITPARKVILEIVFGEEVPMSAIDIQEKLEKRNVKVNKTTVYRELDYLLHQGILKLVYLVPGIAHYESASLPHHHHLVCDNCGKVEEVDCVIDQAMLLKKTDKKGFN